MRLRLPAALPFRQGSVGPGVQPSRIRLTGEGILVAKVVGESPGKGSQGSEGGGPPDWVAVTALPGFGPVFP